MTDLAKVAAVTIEPSALVTAANEYMVARAVRSLFVTAPDGHVLGLVTTTDILGERPVRVSHARGIKRNELLVSDVMTPIESIVAMRIEDVRAAKVGHIVASLKQAGRHHELVAEKCADGNTCDSRHLLGLADRAPARGAAADHRACADLRRDRGSPFHFATDLRPLK